MKLLILFLFKKTSVFFEIPFDNVLMVFPFVHILKYFGKILFEIFSITSRKKKGNFLAIL